MEDAIVLTHKDDQLVAVLLLEPPPPKLCSFAFQEGIVQRLNSRFWFLGPQFLLPIPETIGYCQGLYSGAEEGLNQRPLFVALREMLEQIPRSLSL